MKIKYKGDGKNPTTRDCVDMHDFLTAKGFKSADIPSTTDIYEVAKKEGYIKNKNFGKIPVVVSEPNWGLIILAVIIALIVFYYA